MSYVDLDMCSPPTAIHAESLQGIAAEMLAAGHQSASSLIATLPPRHLKQPQARRCKGPIPEKLVWQALLQPPALIDCRYPVLPNLSDHKRSKLWQAEPKPSSARLPKKLQNQSMPRSSDLLLWAICLQWHQQRVRSLPRNHTHHDAF